MDNSRLDRVKGYAAGIAAGVTYGFNPLFAKPLMSHGVHTSSMLLFRYAIAMALMGIWMRLKGESLSLTRRQIPIIILLGVLFSLSSITLFEAYNYIPSGLATTIVYLYPGFTALTMTLIGKLPPWQVWVSIAVTLLGVCLLCIPSEAFEVRIAGVILSSLSALVYALYLVLVNTSKRASQVSAHAITFYALVTGSVMFLAFHLYEGGGILDGVTTALDVSCLIGLAIFPTIISLLGLAISTRKIGPTRTSVLGAFEPVTAILIGTVIFSEPFTVNIAVGVFLCIAAILFMIRYGDSR